MEPDKYFNNIRITCQASWVSDAAGTLLLIHGSGGDRTKWTGLLERLPQGFNGLAVDLPGHGISSLPLCTTVAEMAGFVKAAVEKLNLPRPLILAGHSMGAAISLYMAIEYEGLLDGIILIGGGARLRVLPSLLTALKEGQVDADFFRLGFSKHTPADIREREVTAYAQVNPAVLAADFNACDNFDVRCELYQVKVPALIIVGKEDRLAPPRYSQYLHKNMAGSILKVIPETGHLILVEKPELVSQAVKEFCSGFQPGSAE